MDGDRAFDATETYLCDRAEERMSRWHTASLVIALSGILARKPEFEHDGLAARLEVFQAAADELTSRGIDSVALLRYGMWPQILGTILSALVQSTAVAAERPGGMSRAAADVWWKALALGDRPTLPDTPAPNEIHVLINKTLLPALPRIKSWIATASLGDLLELRPPSSVVTASASFLESSTLDEQYIWAVDHFSKTFFEDWATSSLHYARRWLDQREVPPCSQNLMSERPIDKVKLDAEIAKRATTRQKKPSAQPVISDMLAGQMQHYATTLLEDNRYREAAAVFAFAVSQAPYYGAFHNNLGFCLIPESPLEALGHLETASVLTKSIFTVNIYNRMCCYIILRRPHEALELANDSWDEIAATRVTGAVLWQRRENSRSWDIFRSEDERVALVELAAAIAHDEGLADGERKWRSRLVALNA